MEFGLLCEKNPKPGWTSLKQYLEYIHPGHEIVVDSPIPKDIFESRQIMHGHKADKYRTYRPDARVEDLNLIVEFDGIDHYQNVSVILKQDDRDRWMNNLGYRVVRIPFYTQLSALNIKHLFGVEVEVCCPYPSGWLSSAKTKYSLNQNCPSNFCYQGELKFIKEYESFPIYTQFEIRKTLQEALKHYSWEWVLSPNLKSYLSL